jgi:hypothetical protein
MVTELCYLGARAPVRYTKGDFPMILSTMIRKPSIILSLTMAAFLGLIPQTATALNLTVTQTGSTYTDSGTNWAQSVITIVDQSNGAVMSCKALLYPNKTAVSTCQNVGTVTPSSTVPTPPVGLSVYQSPNEVTNGIAVLSQVWIINNTTGEISSCYSWTAPGYTPITNCSSIAVAP